LRPAERCPGWALQEEIFGPVLPVFKYRDISEVISFVQQGEKPLAQYIFSKKRSPRLCSLVS
jgi:aldehyde dehydrogenase (NAD+)